MSDHLSNNSRRVEPTVLLSTTGSLFEATSASTIMRPKPPLPPATAILDMMQAALQNQSGWIQGGSFENSLILPFFACSSTPAEPSVTYIVPGYETITPSEPTTGRSQFGTVSGLNARIIEKSIEQSLA
jgi:hypothetical protein